MKLSNILLYNTLRPYWESVRASYWFIPSIMITGALLLGYLSTSWLPEITANAAFKNEMRLLSPEASRTLASTVATSIITATSIAFSMTLVALTMASSQFGPRLLQTFMDDRGTQLVLGTLTSTFIYCLFAVYHLGSEAAQLASASLMGLAVMGVGVADTIILIYYIHHIARFIQADEIIERCYQDCLVRVAVQIPNTENSGTFLSIPEEMVRFPKYAFAINLDQSGYVQRIDYHGILSGKREYISGFHIHVKAGDYVTHTQNVCTVYCIHPIQDEVLSTLKNYIVLGNRRTAIQDTTFGIKQIVEISLRALSPGINDPMTAMTCADRLTTICLYISKRTFPASTVVHRDNAQWMIKETFSFAMVLDTAFSQLRQAAASHPDVLVHLLNCLQKCQQETVAHKTLFNKHIQAVFDNADVSKLTEYDREALNAAYIAALRVSD